MSHAEAIRTLHPAAGATDAIIAFVSELRHAGLGEEVRYYARRHLLDTVGVMIAGAEGRLRAGRRQCSRGCARPGAFRCQDAPGAPTSSMLLFSAAQRGTASSLTTASAKGPCIRVASSCRCCWRLDMTSIQRGRPDRSWRWSPATKPSSPLAGPAIPDLRQRGFHPAATVGVLGSAMAAGKLRGLKPDQLANALGIAASSAAGLFAFVGGGADIKRLHAGHAAREGLQAALLAEQGVVGHPALSRRTMDLCRLSPAASGVPTRHARSFFRPRCRSASLTATSSRIHAAGTISRPSRLSSLSSGKRIFRSKRLSGSMSRLIASRPSMRRPVAEEFASAQLSFPFLIGLALRFRAIKVEHFSHAVRRDPGLRRSRASFMYRRHRILIDFIRSCVRRG